MASKQNVHILPSLKVLVTGSSGQVGSYLVDALRQEGDDPLGVDVRASQWTSRIGDVRSLGSLDADAIVHCAAQISVSRSVEDPRSDAAHNVDGTLAMLELARRRDASRFVYLSSAAVYGSASDVPIRETAPAAPQSPYGMSKLVGEQYAHLYGRLYGVPVVVLRPFNIFSARQDPSNAYSGVISRFAAAVAAGVPPVIHGDGEQTRDFVHVSDVVGAIGHALRRDDAVGGTFNVGTGRGVSVRQLADLMVSLAGLDLEPTFEPPRVADIRHSVADVERLRALGYRPRTDLGRDLKEILSAALSADASGP